MLVKYFVTENMTSKKKRKSRKIKGMKGEIIYGQRKLNREKKAMDGSGTWPQTAKKREMEEEKLYTATNDTEVDKQWKKKKNEKLEKRIKKAKQEIKA